MVDADRFYAAVSTTGKWAGVSRLRFAPEEARNVLEEIHSLAEGATVAWSTPSKALAAALRKVGCRDPEPPILPRCTALAIEHPPSPGAAVEIRRVQSFDGHLTGLEIDLASSGWTEEGAARERAEAPESWERRRTRAGGQWLAYLDGRAVAWASAVAGPRGLYLAGGATLPEARGRGLYRALVRTRWDDAVARGTPALVVHAQETSRPILEQLGFERVATIYELASGGEAP